MLAPRSSTNIEVKLILVSDQECNVGSKGAQFPVHRITMGAPKNPSNVTSTFFNTVHLLPKDLKFEHGASNLLLVPGAI